MKSVVRSLLTGLAVIGIVTLVWWVNKMPPFGNYYAIGDAAYLISIVGYFIVVVTMLAGTVLLLNEIVYGNKTEEK